MTRKYIMNEEQIKLTSSYDKNLVKLALNFFETVIGEGYFDAEEQATKFNGENNAYYNLNALTRFGFQAKFSASSVDYANDRLDKAEKVLNDEQIRDPENYRSSKQALDFYKAIMQWENALSLSTWDALLYTIAMKEPFTISNFDNRWKMYQDAKNMNTTNNVVVDVDAIKERRKHPKERKKVA